MSNFNKVKANGVVTGKMKRRRKRLSQGWARNVLRSLGYSAQDVISELMPNTADAVSTARDIKSELQEATGIAKEKANEGVSYVKNRFKEFNEKDLKDAIEDIKSGKLYNKDRIKETDFGFDDDFGDFGFDENFDDPFGNDVDVSSTDDNTFVKVSMNVGPESPIVQSQDATTAVISSGFEASAKIASEHMTNIMSSISTMSAGITSELKLLTSEVNKLTGTLPETITSQAALTTEYYEKTLGYQERMANALDTIAASKRLAGLGKDEHVRSSIDGKTYMDFGGYFDTIKSQAKATLDDNMAINMLKMYNEMKDMGGPDPRPLLAQGLNMGMKSLIPKLFKESFTKIDELIQDIALPIGMKMNKWKGDWDNPIKQFFGNIFGISTLGKTSADKKEYEKGAVAFDGKVHRAITDVIPTYLSKILSAVSGQEEVAFDYQKGRYDTVSNIRKKFDDTVKEEATNPFMSNTMAYDRAVNALDIDDKQKENLSSTFNDFLYNMVKSGSAASFRENSNRNDIARFTGKDADSPEVKFIRQYFESLYDKGMHTELNEIFSRNTVRARANLDKMYKSMEKDGTYMNYNLIDNGFDQNGKHKMKIGSTDSNLATDKYGNSSMYYLREILETLNTGIRVITVGSSSEGARQINDRRKLVTDNFKNHEDILTERMRANSDEESEGTGDLTGVNLDSSVFDDAIRTYDDDKGDDRLGWLAGKFKEDSKMRKLIEGWKNRRQKGRDLVKKATNSITGFVIDMIYGPKKKSNNGEDSDPDNPDNPDDVADNAKKSIAAGLMGHMKDFSESIHNVVIKPLKDALFDDDDGLITNMAETANQWKQSIKQKLIGTKDDDGFYKGGMISGIANAPKKTKDAAKHIKDMLLNGDPEGNEPAVIKAIRETIGTDDNGKLDLKGKGSGIVASLRQHISKRAHEWTDNIFGPSDEEGPHKLDVFLGDIHDNKGAIGITTGIGLLSSFFLPFGPVGGALFGLASGIGISSSQFKDFIFGPDDEDGNRTGGLISKEWQNKFNDNKDALAKGASVGLLGSMFLPGGPIMGAVVGAGLGLAAKTDAFSELLYGPGGSKDDPTGGIGKYIKDQYGKDKTIKDAAIDTGIGAGAGIIGSIFLPGGPVLGALVGGGLAIARKTELFSEVLYGEGGTKENPTGGLTQIIKDHYNSDKTIDDTFLDAGIGAGAGIIGSFFLPSGPIMGALIGTGLSLGVNSEKFQEWLFGEKGEDGTRYGGALHKVTDKVSDFFYDNTEKLGSWMNKNVINPLKASIDPIKERFVNYFNDKKNDVKDFIFGEKDPDGVRHNGLLGAIADRVNNSAFGELKDVIKTEVIDKIKNGFKKLFDGFFGILGSIVKAPVDLIKNFAKESEEKNMARLRETANMEGPLTDEQKRARDKARSRLTFFENGYDLESNIKAMNDESDEKAKKKREEREKKKEERRKRKLTPEQKTAENTETMADSTKATADTAKEQLEETRTANKGILAGLNTIIGFLTGDSKNKKSGDMSKNESSESEKADVVLDPESIKNDSNDNSDDIINASDNTESKKKTSQKKQKTSGKGRKNKKNAQRKQDVTKTQSQNQDDSETVSDDVIDNKSDTESQIEDDSRIASVISRLKSKNQGELIADQKFREQWNRVVAEIRNRGSQVGDTIGNLFGNNQNKPEDSPSNTSGAGVAGNGTLVDALKSGDSGEGSSSIGANVSKIAKSVNGQLDGLGYNTWKIYKLLKRRLGRPGDDDDDDGEIGNKNKRRRGVLGKALDFALKPFHMLHDAGSWVVGKVKSGFTMMKNAVVKGVKGVVGGIIGAGKALFKLPALMIKGTLKAIPKLVSGIGSLVKGAGRLIGSGLESLGNMLKGASKGFGEAVGNAISGITGLLGGAFKGLGQLLYGAGIVGKEVVVGAAKLGFGAVKGIAKVGGKAVSWVSDKLFNRDGKGNRKNIGEVTITGGTIDLIKKIEVVEKIGKNKKKGSSDSTEEDSPIIQAAALLGGLPTGKDIKDKFSKFLSDKKGKALDLYNKGKDKLHDLYDDGKAKISGIYDVGKTKAKNAKNKLSGFFGMLKGSEDGGADTGDPNTSDDGIGATAREIVRQRAEDREREEQRSMFSRLIETIKSGNDENKEHHSIWSSIFSKKGLITMGLIAAAPIILKGVKWLFTDGKALFDGIKTTVVSVLDSIKKGFNFVGGIIGIKNNIEEEANDMAEAAGFKEREEYELDDEGNLVTDEDGNYKKKSYGKEGFFKRWSEYFNPTKTKINEDGEVEQGKGLVPHQEHMRKRAARHLITKPLIKHARKKKWKAAKTKILTKAYGLVGKEYKPKVGLAEKGMNAIKNTKVVTKVTDVVSTKVNTVIKWCKEAVVKVIEEMGKVLKKVGVKSGDNIAGKTITKIADKLVNVEIVSKFLGKFSGMLGKVATAAGTLATSELFWAATGAVAGAVHPANLFHVDPTDVDTTMTLISAGMEAILATSFAGWIDILDDICLEIFGFSFLSGVAEGIYAVCMDDYSSAKLKEAKAKFKDGYEDHVEETYNKFVEKEKAEGREVNMTLEEFKQSDLSPEYSDYVAKNTGWKASIKSKFDNAKDNVSHMWNVARGKEKLTQADLRHAKKNLFNLGGVAGGLFDKRDTMSDEEWYNMTKEQRDAINKADFNDSLMGSVVNTVRNTGENLADKMGVTAMVDLQKRAKRGEKITQEEAETVYKNFNKGVLNSLKGFISPILVFGGSDIADSVTAEYDNRTKSTSIEDFTGGKGGKDSKSSSSGVVNNFPYYSQNDPSIKNKDYRLSSGERDTMGNRGCGPTALSMVASGLTGRDIDPTKLAQYATDNGYSQESGTMPGYFGSAAKSLGLSSQSARPTRENVESMLRSGQPIILQGQNSREGSPYTSDGHYIVGVGMRGNDVIVNDPRGKQYSGSYPISQVLGGAQNLWGFSKQGATDESMLINGFSGLGGEDAADMANGFPYLQQGDPRWGKTMYSATGDKSQTISTSGCGPTSMAMVARSFGHNVTPIDTINYALDNGFRTANSGTSWGFFDSISQNKYGLKAVQYGNADSALSNLKYGKPVIASMGPSTFTKGGHYIVLSGMTENGEILVNDPSSPTRTAKAWDPAIFSKEGKQFWAFENELGNGSINKLAQVGDINLPDTVGTGDTTMEAGAPSSKKETGKETVETTTGEETEKKSPFTILSDLGSIIMDAGKKAFEQVFSVKKSTNLGSNLAGNLASTMNTASDMATGNTTNSKPGSIANVMNTGGRIASGTIVNSADDITGGDTAERGWNYFTGMGYSKPATAGILGNLEAESGLNPKIIQGNGKGPAAGLAQWENYNTKSGRWNDMRLYAESKGKDWTDEGSQLEFINNELNKLENVFWKSEKNMKKAGTTGTTFEEWKNSTDVDTATRQFEGAFERAGKPHMERRISAAQKYYDKFSTNNAAANTTDSDKTINGNPKPAVATPSISDFAGMGGKGGNDKPQSLFNIGAKGDKPASTEVVSSDWMEKSDIARNYNIELSRADASVNTELIEAINKTNKLLGIIADNTQGTRVGVDKLFNKTSSSVSVTGGNNSTVNNNISTPSQQNKDQDQSHYNTAREIAKGIYVPA